MKTLWCLLSHDCICIRSTSTDGLYHTSVNFPGMLNRIRFQFVLGGYRTHPALQEDGNRYGADSFTFEVLDVLPPSAVPRTTDPKKERAVPEKIGTANIPDIHDRSARIVSRDQRRRSPWRPP